MKPDEREERAQRVAIMGLCLSAVLALITSCVVAYIGYKLSEGNVIVPIILLGAGILGADVIWFYIARPRALPQKSEKKKEDEKHWANTGWLEYLCE